MRLRPPLARHGAPIVTLVRTAAHFRPLFQPSLQNHWRVSCFLSCKAHRWREGQASPSPIPLSVRIGERQVLGSAAAVAVVVACADRAT